MWILSGTVLYDTRTTLREDTHSVTGVGGGYQVIDPDDVIAPYREMEPDSNDDDQGGMGQAVYQSVRSFASRNRGLIRDQSHVVVHDAAETPRNSVDLTSIRAAVAMNGPSLPGVIMSPPARAPSEEGRCVVCMDTRANQLILPCNHLCVCSDCLEHLRTVNSSDSALCPICRSVILSATRVFLT
jgi:hypothetical protein